MVCLPKKSTATCEQLGHPSRCAIPRRNQLSLLGHTAGEQAGPGLQILSIAVPRREARYLTRQKQHRSCISIPSTLAACTCHHGRADGSCLAMGGSLQA